MVNNVDVGKIRLWPSWWMLWFQDFVFHCWMLILSYNIAWGTIGIFRLQSHFSWVFVPFNWYWTASVRIYQQIDGCRSCNNSSAYSLQFTIYSTLMRVSEVCLNNKSLRCRFEKENFHHLIFMSTINSAFLPQFFFALFTWKKTYRKGFRMYRFGTGHTWIELIWYIFSCHQICSPFLFLSLCSHYRKISLDTINESHLFINVHPVESNFLLDKV